MAKYGMSTFIGETMTGLPQPIFFDLHYPILLNNPPVTLITGSPGSGKTYFGQTLISHASALNKMGIVFDPKGDFISLKRLEQLGYLNKIEVWSVLAQDGSVIEENIGMLDPTSISVGKAECVNTTLDVIKILVGELTPAQTTTLTPIVKDIVESQTPSFGNVVKSLLRNRNDEIRSLGYSLDSQLNAGLAQLLVSNRKKKKKQLELKEGFVVVNLMGLKLPADNKNKNDYTTDEKLSVIIMNLLTDIALKLMHTLPKKIYKTLIVDEAWAILATEAGRNTINSIARLGRSLNLATLLITQSPKHLDMGDSNDLQTMISTRFAFRNNDLVDNNNTIINMQLPEDEGWQEVIQNLQTGETLMQDVQKQISVIQVMAPSAWAAEFNTNPIAILNGS